MMNTDDLNTISQAALERSAFVFAEPDDSAGAPPTYGFARIRVSGSVNGELQLAASEGFLRELAASLLGVEPNEVDPVSHGADALKEMANMIAGSVVLHYDGENRAYSLGLPSASDRTSFESAWARGLTTTLLTNGEPLALVWTDDAGSVRQAA